MLSCKLHEDGSTRMEHQHETISLVHSKSNSKRNSIERKIQLHGGASMEFQDETSRFLLRPSWTLSHDLLLWECNLFMPLKAISKEIPSNERSNCMVEPAGIPGWNLQIPIKAKPNPCPSHDLLLCKCILFKPLRQSLRGCLRKPWWHLGVGGFLRWIYLRIREVPWRNNKLDERRTRQATKLDKRRTRQATN